MALIDDLTTAFGDAGLPVEIIPTVQAAVTAAGWEFQPAGGGSPASVLATVAPTIYGVDGCPGVFIYEVTMGDSSVLRWVQFAGAAAAAGARTVGAGSLPATAGA